MGAAFPLHYAQRMEPEAPRAVVRSVIDEDRERRISRERRESLTAELAALVEQQVPCPAEGPALPSTRKRENRKLRY